MDRNLGYILNDILDVVEQLAKIQRELYPGASYDFIDFLLARVDRQLNEALEALERS